MDRLLRHIDAITRRRHRGELAATTVAALRDLTGAGRVALYKTFAAASEAPEVPEVVVALVAEADAFGAKSYNDGISWPTDAAPIGRLPRLREHLDRESAAGGAVVRADDPKRLVLTLRQANRELFGFVEIETDRPLDTRHTALAEGLLGVMMNCVAMLEYSETDTLTGLLNRKTFDQYLLDILSRTGGDRDESRGRPAAFHRRHAHPDASRHWLGVADIDHFKQVNDRFGHLIGDEVLILIANLMRKSFRAQDKLFRFGGEEFVMLLKPIELRHAQAAFERFRRMVQDCAFPQVGHVTISIGFTGIGLRDTPGDILGNADEALYWAKEHGRNQTCCYEVLCAEGHLRRHLANTEADMFQVV